MWMASRAVVLLMFYTSTSAPTFSHCFALAGATVQCLFPEMRIEIQVLVIYWQKSKRLIWEFFYNLNDSIKYEQERKNNIHVKKKR
jgi:hypothetical protein